MYTNNSALACAAVRLDSGPARWGAAAPAALAVLAAALSARPPCSTWPAIMLACTVVALQVEPLGDIPTERDAPAQVVFLAWVLSAFTAAVARALASPRRSLVQGALAVYAVATVLLFGPARAGAYGEVPPNQLVLLALPVPYTVAEGISDEFEALARFRIAAETARTTSAALALHAAPIPARLRERRGLGYAVCAVAIALYAVVTLHNDCPEIGGAVCAAPSPAALFCDASALVPTCDVDGLRVLSAAATVTALAYGTALADRLAPRATVWRVVVAGLALVLSAAPHWLFAATSAQLPAAANTTLLVTELPCNPWEALDPHLALAAAQALGGMIVVHAVQADPATGRAELYLP